MPSGFCGGHGYASTIGTALNNSLGREDGVVLGQTFATVGLLVGLFVGIACINYATRHGGTRLVEKAESLPAFFKRNESTIFISCNRKLSRLLTSKPTSPVLSDNRSSKRP